MVCYYCSKEDLTIDDVGNCDHCSKSVCSRPNARNDDVAHGASCRCGCGVLVCRYHRVDHVTAKHKGAVTHCFPEDSLAIALRAFASTHDVTGLSIGRSEYLIDMPSGTERAAPYWISEFLNVVEPGRTRLLEQLRRSNPRAAQQVEANDSYVLLDPRNMSPATMAQLVARTADSSINAWRRWKEIEPSESILAGHPQLSHAAYRLEALDQHLSEATCSDDPFGGRSLDAYGLLSPNVRTFMEAVAYAGTQAPSAARRFGVAALLTERPDSAWARIAQLVDQSSPWSDS